MMGINQWNINLCYYHIEVNINGINEKLFETPKVNAGNIKLYRNEVPNPYYIEPSTSSSIDSTNQEPSNNHGK